MSVALAPGERFEGRYTVVRALNSDAWSSTFEVTLDENGYRACLRVITPGDASEQGGFQVRERLRNDLRLATGVEHDAVERVFEYGDCSHGLFVVSEWIAGTPLDQLLAERGKMKPESVTRVMVRVLGALGAAHRMGLVHGDVRPGRIIVPEAGLDATKLTGAAICGPVSAETPHMGTAGYLAPEVLRGEDAGPGADLFSLGIAAIEMLTGAPAYPGPSVEARIAAQRAGRPSVPPTLAVVPLYRDVIFRLLEVAPRDRYLSVEEVLDDLGVSEPPHPMSPAAAAAPPPAAQAPAIPVTQPSPAVVGPPGADTGTGAASSVPETTSGGRSSALPWIIAVVVLALALAGVLAWALSGGDESKASSGDEEAAADEASDGEAFDGEAAAADGDEGASLEELEALTGVSAEDGGAEGAATDGEASDPDGSAPAKSDAAEPADGAKAGAAAPSDAANDSAEPGGDPGHTGDSPWDPDAIAAASADAPLPVTLGPVEAGSPIYLPCKNAQKLQRCFTAAAVGGGEVVLDLSQVAPGLEVELDDRSRPYPTRQAGDQVAITLPEDYLFAELDLVDDIGQSYTALLYADRSLTRKAIVTYERAVDGQMRADHPDDFAGMVRPLPFFAEFAELDGDDLPELVVHGVQRLGLPDARLGYTVVMKSDASGSIEVRPGAYPDFAVYRVDRAGAIVALLAAQTTGCDTTGSLVLWRHGPGGEPALWFDSRRLDQVSGLPTNIANSGDGLRIKLDVDIQTRELRAFELFASASACRSRSGGYAISW